MREGPSRHGAPAGPAADLTVVRPVRTPFLLLRRARAQAGLLTCVTALAVAGATLVGLCSLLLTAAQDQALEAAVRGTAPASVAVTAAVTMADDATQPDVVAAALAQVSATATAAFRPFPTSTSVWATSTPRYLAPMPDGDLRATYLLEGDDLTEHAVLTAGTWPAHGTALTQVALLDSTARLLGVAPGSTVVLAGAPQHLGEAPADPLTVQVVGTFTPRRGDRTWDRDPLGAAGYAPRGASLPTYGPLVVAPGTLVGHSPVARFHVVVTPDLHGATVTGISAARGGLDGLRTALEQGLGARAQALALTDDYPDVLRRMRQQLGVTDSEVLVAALLAAALGATALGLAGRLLADRRAGETVLLRARGAAGSQLAARATVEALGLAAVAGGAAVPLSVTAYRSLAAVPRLADAGLSAATGVTATLVMAAVSAAVALCGVLVVASLRATRPPGRRSRVGMVARSGVDVILVGLAVVGYLQLRAHGVANGSAVDPVLVAAPVLCLVGGAVVALRLLPWVARLAELHASRSRRLVLPLAGWEVARRHHSTAGAFLLVLATAGGTFGLTFATTWERSQGAQADAQVGMQLQVDPGAVAAGDEGPALAAATGGVPMAVAQRPVALGTHLGLDATGAAPQLVATDVRRGFGAAPPPPGTTWDDVTAGLATARPAGPLLPGDAPAALEITGTTADGTPVLVTPSLVVRDRWGGQAVRPGAQVPLDGRPHRVDVPLGGAGGLPAADQVQVTALDLALALGPGAAPPGGFDQTTTLTVSVVLRGPAAPAGTSATWFGASPPNGWQITRGAEVSEHDGADGAAVTATASVSLTGLLYTSGSLLLVAGEPAEEVPAVVSRALADELGVGPGGRLSLMVDEAALDARVVGVVPYVPSAVGTRAVLVDRTTLDRALLALHDLEPLTDRWWVDGVPDPAAAAAAVRAAGLGQPTARDGLIAQLRDGPLRIAFVAAMWTLVAAACVLALSGTAAHVASMIGARNLEVARLLGLGMSRRAVRATFLAQHAAVCVVAVGAGALLGTGVSRALGPLLVVSSTGGRPVPEALVVWPWTSLAVLVGLLVVGSTVVAVPVARAAVRRASATHLRMDVQP
ncbi:MAG: hypothetical protein BGO38_09010 [Cellulomonas sp. 73-145]|uniref:FtsX-like permease family protein n=1 Tax=Cellulomonas sp. 73-145 TaxID=1895739 RepID=UPI000929E991|nr:FtsX-like permease family protein [Cellulomonas sp. 73-145]OJV60869.1 MAG: hypothetical protein BGO38_09010 [Cellulomonas sp. 73-145]